MLYVFHFTSPLNFVEYHFLFSQTLFVSLSLSSLSSSLSFPHHLLAAQVYILLFPNDTFRNSFDYRAHSIFIDAFKLHFSFFSLSFFCFSFLKSVLLFYLKSISYNEITTRKNHSTLLYF